MAERPDLTPVESAVDRHKQDAGRDCACNWCALYRYAAALEREAGEQTERVDENLREHLAADHAARFQQAEAAGEAVAATLDLAAALEREAGEREAGAAAIKAAIEELDLKLEQQAGPDGFVELYLLQTGPWHQLLGLARGVDAGAALFARLAQAEAERNEALQRGADLLTAEIARSTQTERERDELKAFVAAREGMNAALERELAAAREALQLWEKFAHYAAGGSGHGSLTMPFWCALVFDAAKDAGRAALVAAASAEEEA